MSHHTFRCDGPGGTMYATVEADTQREAGRALPTLMSQVGVAWAEGWSARFLRRSPDEPEDPSVLFWKGPDGQYQGARREAVR